MASLNSVASTKYRYQFTSDEGTARSWQIREEGFNYQSVTPYDLTTELTGSGRGHCQIEWLNGGNDEYGEIMGSRATVNLFDSSGALLTDLFQDADDIDNTYALAIMEGATQIWIGMIDTGDLVYNEDGPTELTITASDGLGRLADQDYVDSTATGLLPTGRSSILDVIQSCLAKIPWQLDFYTATDMRPKVDGTQLLATDDPLDNIYVDVSTFRIRGGDEDIDSPVTYLEVLKACLTRFGMKVFQAENAWHCVQVNHLYNSSYRRWKYNYLGTLDSTAVYDPRVTVSTTEEDVGRGPGTIGSLPPYSAAMSTYDHGVSVIVQNPTMDPPLRRGGRNVSESNSTYGDSRFNLSGGAFRGRSVSTSRFNRGNIYDPAIAYWDTSDAGVKHQHGGSKGSTGYVMYIEDYDAYDWKTDVDAADWASLNTQIGTRHSKQVTIPEIPSGSQFALYAEAYIKGEEGTAADDWREGGPLDAAIAIKIKLDTAGTDYYAEVDAGYNTFSWSTNANTWMVFPVYIANDWIGLNGIVCDALPAAGNLEIQLGPLLENSHVNSPVSGNVDFLEAVLWDNVDIELKHADGTFNSESSTTVNFLDRSSPVLKEVVQAMGDGPISITPGRLSNDSANSDDTSDWKEVATVHDGTAGDTVDEVTTRMLLRSMNRSRKLHSAEYFDISQTVTPLDVLVKSSTNYPAYEITFDVQGDTNSGTWYEAREDGFTDDLVNGLDAGKNRSAFLGRGLGDRAAFLISQLNTAFLTSGVQAITFTTAAIAAGTAHNAKDVGIAVDAITEPLLKNDDNIVMWAPNLNVYQLKVNGNQEAGDTIVKFDDPDNPGTDFSFPENVASGAGIFLVPEELATIARLGEQGFALTVNDTYIGRVDGAQSKGSGIQTITVKDWTVKSSPGDVLYSSVDDGTFTVSTSTTYPLDTSLTLNLGTAYNFADNEEFYADGQVGRADFIITKDEASVAVNRSDANRLLIGTTNAAYSSATLSITLSGTLNAAVEEGDYLIIVNDDDKWDTTDDTIRVTDAASTSDSTIFVDDPNLPGTGWTPSGTFSSGSKLYIMSKQVMEGRLSIKADEISALITRTSDQLDTFNGDQTVNATEQTTNGTFVDPDTDWTKGAGWAVTGGKAVATAGFSSDLEQTGAGITNGTKYSVRFTVSDRTAGSVTVKLGGTSGTARSTNATFTEQITAGAGGAPDIEFTKDSSFDGKIDDVTIREVLVVNGLNRDAKAGDIVYHWDTSLRTLTTKTVFHDADSAQTGITLTANTTVEDDDILFTGLVSGLNIEFGSIDVVNSYIQSSNYVAGTTGWHIDEDGSAEFANATVRGTVFAGTAKFGDNVSGTDDGIWLDSENYWYDTGQFSLGGTNGMAYSGSGDITVGSDLDINGDATISGDLTVSGSLTVSASTGVTNTSGDFTLDETNGLDFSLGSGSGDGDRAVTWNVTDSTHNMTVIGTEIASDVRGWVMVTDTGVGRVPVLTLEALGPSAGFTRIQLTNTSIGVTGDVTFNDTAKTLDTLTVDNAGLELEGIAAPGGTANYGTIYADINEKPGWYVGTSGPFAMLYENATADATAVTPDTRLHISVGGTDYYIEAEAA